MVRIGGFRSSVGPQVWAADRGRGIEGLGKMIQGIFMERFEEVFGAREVVNGGTW